MNFKQSLSQNQRIERITNSHVVIGIDIAKFTHVARAVNYRGIELGQPLSFSNDLKGFQSFHEWISQLKKKTGKSFVLIGMEPTGHYWLNLAFWLKELAYELVLVNPFHVKRNKENRDNSPSKNDLKDALVIADMVKNGYYSELHLPSVTTQALRQLVTMRELTVKQSVSIINQIHRWIDMFFPELKNVFKDVTCKTSLATLTLFPLPSEILRLSPDDMVLQWKRIMKRSGSRATAQEIIQAARQSSGLTTMPDQAKLIISLLLQQLDMLKNQLSTLEKEMENLLVDLPSSNSLRTIKGISSITLAILYSEAGDLSNFRHGRQLLRLAGLHLSENSSGIHKGEVKITKRGRPLLRKLLYLTVKNMVAINPEFRILHQKNKQEKNMSGMKSIMKLLGKLARILVAMARTQTAYIPGKISSLAA